MTAGAFAGWFTVYPGGDLWTGVLVAALAGALFGLLHAALTVPLGLSQHVTGIGITLLATSLTYFAYRLALPEVTSPPQDRAVPAAADPRPVGHARCSARRCFSQTPLTYLAFVTVAVVAWVLYRTPLGLAVRAVGENPSAVEAQGISVTAHPHRRGHGRQRADGGRRRLPHHVGLQLLLLRDDQRPRLDLHRARRLRLVAAGQGAARARSCSPPSTPTRCACSSSPAASCPTRCS